MPTYYTWNDAYNAQLAGWDYAYSDNGIVAGTHQADANLHWTYNQDHLAIQDLISCIGAVRQAIFDLMARNSTSTPKYASLWMLNYLKTHAGTPVMGDILTAMLLAKYDELQKFIGIEDAYRSAIWGQPFNSEFYAALARGFMP